MEVKDMAAAWEKVLSKRQIHKDIVKAAQMYPEIRSVYVRYIDIYRVSPELAEELLTRPQEVLRLGEKVIKSLTPPELDAELNLRIKELPEDAARVEIRHLRSKHVGKFISVEGLVRRVTEVRPRVVEALFKCEVCRALITEPQDETYIREPIVCYKTQGGCGKPHGAVRFKLIVNEAEGRMPKTADTQKAEIQEYPEGMRGGEQPRRLELYIQDDLTGILSPGNRVVLNGILKNRVRGRGSSRSTFFEIYLHVNSIELRDQEFEEIHISKEEERMIKKLAKDPDIKKKIVASIVPSIYGMEIEKETIALQLFGGVPKVLPDGNRIRGDIHVLLVGDPGVAKSQILSYVARLAPRGIYASGKSASAAGLTAAATRSEEFGEGRWTLEAGALVLADKGICCIDELDKMSSTDRDSIHTAMEQQQISFAKAGITATLQTRCAILAAANPKTGRFVEPITDLPSQIDLDPPLLSRFDVIFTITDRPDRDVDQSMAEHILKIHFAGEAAAYRKVIGDDTYRDEEMCIEREKGPPIEPDMLRKYIAYAKRNIVPVLTREAMEVIRDYYVAMRHRTDGSLHITPRQEEALIRLSEANARLHLRNRVIREDAETAIRILRYFIDTAARGEDGQVIDFDIITTGYSSSQRDRVLTILDIIKSYGDTGISKAELMRQAEAHNLPLSKIEHDLERLSKEGRIYEFRNGIYKTA